MDHRGIVYLAGALIVALSVPHQAAAVDLGTWAEGTSSAMGATRDSYNAAAGLKWKHRMGDWVDRAGGPQGRIPWASAAYNQSETIDLDVTGMVKGSVADDALEQGFFLTVADKSHPLDIHSRENKDERLRPRLILRFAGGTSREYEASGDVGINASTYKSDGGARILKLQPRSAAVLLRFAVPPKDRSAALESALVRLHVARIYGKKKGVVEVFRPAPGYGDRPVMPLPGLAAAYPGDAGIDGDPRVHFATDFSDRNWTEKVGPLPQTAQVIRAGDHGDALEVVIPRGKNLGLNASFDFAKWNKAEPEHVFFRYYASFSDDWRPSDGGKMPGLSGTYGRAGWGGRSVNGKNGWSARGGFLRSLNAGDGSLYVPLSSYVYHVDGKAGPYGEHFVWSMAQRGILEPNRWYCIEQELRLNTPGQNDGVLNVWVDGRPALRRSDLRFRDTDALKIEKVWFDIYHGGMTPAPGDLTLRMDNIVVADEYIGPALLPQLAKDWWLRED